MSINNQIQINLLLQAIENVLLYYHADYFKS